MGSRPPGGTATGLNQAERDGGQATGPDGIPDGPPDGTLAGAGRSGGEAPGPRRLSWPSSDEGEDGGEDEDDLAGGELPGWDVPGPEVDVEAEVEVVVEDPAWRAAVPRLEAVVRRAAAAAAAEAGWDGAVTVLLTGDHQVRRLNGDHRGKVKPTNVLSFPGPFPGTPGDVALALGVVRREARAAGRSVMAHLSHLVAHGVLHLAGHDHLRAGEARRMERAEARIMRRLALPNPWRGVA